MQYSYHLNSENEIICGSENNPEYENNKWHGCRKVACEIERNFSYKISNFLTNPIEFYEKAKTLNKYHVEPIGNTSKDNPKNSEILMRVQNDEEINGEECCGNYPDRFPFMKLTHQCCGGLVQSLGSC